MYNSSVTNWQPRSGPTTGGTRVRVYGFFANTGAARAAFGAAVLPCAYVSDREVDCPSPVAAVAGGVPMSVCVDDASVWSPLWVPVGQFQYYEPPQLAAIAPPLGPLSGATSVVVSGAGFVGTPDAILVSLTSGDGGGAGTVRGTLSGSTVTFFTPPFLRSRRGLLAVEVALNGQQFTATSPPVLFTMYADPVIASVVPPFSPVRGGATVVLLGGVFVDTPTRDYVRVRITSVSTGAVSTAPATVVDNGTLVFATTAGAAGDAVLSVSLNAQNYAPSTGSLARYARDANLHFPCAPPCRRMQRVCGTCPGTHRPCRPGWRARARPPSGIGRQ